MAAEDHNTDLKSIAKSGGHFTVERPAYRLPPPPRRSFDRMGVPRASHDVTVRIGHFIPTLRVGVDCYGGPALYYDEAFSATEY